MQLVNIGFGNVVAVSKIVSVVSPESAPLKRLVQDYRERGSLVDATFGRRTRSIIITDGNLAVLSAVAPETIAGRISGKEV
ncbi:UPF0296 protein [Clostridia bacterium]|nr:UPF0296 protein [Clostridia bacterium]GHU74025.1 UPF0296 protein [Clostridia bacterium]